MADPARVLEDALTLTTEDRARIAHELIHSLEPEDAEASRCLEEGNPSAR